MRRPTTRLTPHTTRYLRLLNSGLVEGFESPQLATQKCFGIQAQETNAGFISLWNRLQHTHTIKQLHSLVDDDQHLVRVWGCRGTLHFYHPGDWGVVNAVVGPEIMSRFSTRLEKRGTMEEFQRELKLAIGKLQEGHLTSETISTNVRHLVHMAITLGGHGFRVNARRGNRMQLIHRQQSAVRIEEIDQRDALVRAAKRYFATYGPATAADFRYWLGVRVQLARDTVEHLVREGVLVEVETEVESVDGKGGVVDGSVDGTQVKAKQEPVDVKQEPLRVAPKPIDTTCDTQRDSTKRRRKPVAIAELPTVKRSKRLRSSKKQPKPSDDLHPAPPNNLHCEWDDGAWLPPQLLMMHDQTAQLSGLCVPLPAELPVKLLGRFETTILAHADKRWLLTENQRKLVWGKSAQVFATVLVHGRICGTWKHKLTRSGKMLTVTIKPFQDSYCQKLLVDDAETKTKIQEQADALGRFLGATEVAVATEDE